MPDTVDYSLYYKRFHDGSEQDLRNRVRIYRKLLDPVIDVLPSGAAVLDFGCGNGGLLRYLAQRFHRPVGVDANASQVQAALDAGMFATHVPVPDFSRWAAHNSGSFDAIFLLDVLEHIPAPDQVAFMRTLSSTLKQGGYLFLQVPNASSLLAARWRYNDWTHTSSFTEFSLDFVCESAGLERPQYFKDESSLSRKCAWIPRPSLFNYYLKQLFRGVWKLYLRSELGPQAGNISLGYNLMARARKRIE